MNKRERMLKKRKKATRLIKLSDNGLIFSDVGESSDDNKYFQPKKDKRKKKLKGYSKRCIRAYEKIQLKKYSVRLLL